MVDVPENAVRDEPIAFGMTGVQLGICGVAVLVAAILNLLPIWEPIRVIVMVLGAGPLVIVAALPIRGEPAYRWLVRWIRFLRGRRVWRAELVASNKPQISGGEYGSGDGLASGVGDRESVPLAGAAPMEDDATERIGDAQGAQERADMQDRPPRLRLVRTQAPTDAIDERDGAATPESGAVPHLLGGLRIVCFTSFVGGVGKTTLAVEAASLVGSRARYRTLDGELRPLRVLLLDAARTNPAAALRLGLDAATVSRSLTRYDWPDPITFERQAVDTARGVTLLTLPQLPMQGLGPELPFGPIEAAGLLDAAEQAGFQLLVADLGNQIEEGHRHLIGQAATVLGVVTPRVEALPDVIRITSYVRAMGAGRKLAFVANRSADLGSLPALVDGEQVPLVATIDDLGAFDIAGDRGVPAWTDDPGVEVSLQPLATAVWPLFSGVPASSEHRFRSVLAGVRRLLHAEERR